MSCFIRLFCCLCLCLFGVFAVEAEETCGLPRAEAAMNFTLGRLYSLFGTAVEVPSVRILQDVRDMPHRDELSVFGYYDPHGETLYVACSDGRIDWFDVAVRHEVTHHYLAKSFGDFPAWLAEGLAAYMEVGVEDGMEVRHYINKPRFDEFVDLLKWSRAPSVMQLLSGSPLPKQVSQYYAGYWALVFALMHNSDEAVQNQRRQLLRSLLNERQRDSLAIGQRFVESLSAENGNLAQWELRWRRTLWDLR